jgi:hypothetical protein
MQSYRWLGSALPIALGVLGMISVAQGQEAGRIVPGPVIEGYAGKQAEPVNMGAAEALVVKRAQERWDAARAADFEKSYSYTLPSYRALTSLKMFRAAKVGEAGLVGADVISAKCSQFSCDVKVGIKFLSPFMSMPGVELSTFFDERWVLEDGQWWLFVH